MSKKAGRPSKYNNEETAKKLEELVYLYKKQNPSGLVKVSKMVAFSKEMNEINPEHYPLYNKDVWSSYGKEYIERANEPIKTVLTSDSEAKIELPNILDIIEKYNSNKEKLIEYLLPLENILHKKIAEATDSKKELEKIKEEFEDVKEKKKLQEEVIKVYADFVMKMAHESYRKKNEGFLKNQISVNANERNKKAMRNLDDLGAFFNFEDKSNYNIEKEEEKSENKVSALSNWKKKKEELGKS